MDDELTQGSPEGQPDQTAAPEAQAEQEFIDLKNRDESWRVPKDLFTQFADQIGWDPNRLKDALEIGSDGRQLYSRIDEERDRIAEEARQLQAIRDQYEKAQQQYRPPAPPQEPQRYGQRPPPEDVTGNVLWAAAALERIAPLLERIPEIEKNQGFINQQIQRRDEAIETAEERATAMRAYQETAEMWKKEYGMEPPSQRELEAYLRRFPISDNIDMSWQEVWDKAAWMVKGPAAFRQARRQAVLNAQQPDATIRVPMNRAPAMPQSMNGVVDPNADAETQFQQMAKAVGNMTFRDLQGGG